MVEYSHKIQGDDLVVGTEATAADVPYAGSY